MRPSKATNSEIAFSVIAEGVPASPPEEDRFLALTPTEELLQPEMLQEKNVRAALPANQPAKRCNEKRVMAERLQAGLMAPCTKKVKCRGKLPSAR